MKTIKINTEEESMTARMSNRAYHREGKPNWWVFYKKNPDDSPTWVRFGFVRGDDYLNVEVQVPDDAKIVRYGVGARDTGYRGEINF